MKVETLNCPMCGAAASSDAPLCEFCGSRLATMNCSSCFGVMFIGSKFCPRCGATAGTREEAGPSSRKCPRCQLVLRSLIIGQTQMYECDHCLGLWLDIASFEKLCADHEQQSVVLGTAKPAPENVAEGAAKVNYVPCPECSQLMNRLNFAHCSGVVVDVCKKHGTWFDRDELSRIIEFVQAGGMERSRTKERLAIEEEREHLRQQQLELDGRRGDLLTKDQHRLGGIASARGLLDFLLE